MRENEVIELLDEYSRAKKALDGQACAIVRFKYHQEVEKIYRERVEEVESLLELLRPSKEFTLLYLHYAEGIPVEKCAEYMYVSRSTAYRIMKTAHKILREVMEAEG